VLQAGSLPKGRHKLSRDQVAASQHARLIQATIELGNERGFASLTLTDIVGRAGVARSTFYEYFTDKEACFLAAFDLAADLVLDRVLAPLPDNKHTSLVETYTTRFLDLCIEQPALAQLVAVNVGTLGPAAAERQRATRNRLADGLVALRNVLRRSNPDLAPISRLRALAIVGAVSEILQHAFHQTGRDALPSLHAEIASVMRALLEAPAAAPPARASRRRR
jgi:AcrR family transcriptional regulator